MRWLFPVVVLLSAMAVTNGKNCQLEEQGWCLFEEDTCTFSDVYRLPTDKSSPLEVLLDKNIRSKDANNGCPLPQPQPANATTRKPFVIEIEPCFSNGTATPANLKACPDIPDEYYEDLGKRVLSNEGSINEASGAIMGIPIEYNVLSIGKNLMLGNIQNTKSKQAQNGVQGTLLSKFRWRTLPLTAEAYAKTMQETAATFLTSASQYTAQVRLPTNTWPQFYAADDPGADGKNKVCLAQYRISPSTPVWPKPLVSLFDADTDGFSYDVPYWNETDSLWYDKAKPWGTNSPDSLETCMSALGTQGDEIVISWAKVWPLAVFDASYSVIYLKNPYTVDRTKLISEERIPLPGCAWQSQIKNANQPKYLNLYETPGSLLDFLRSAKLPGGSVIRDVVLNSLDPSLPFNDYTVPGTQSDEVSLLSIFGNLIGSDLEKGGQKAFAKIISQAGFVANLQLYATNIAKTYDPTKCTGVGSTDSNINAQAASTLYLLAFFLEQAATDFPVNFQLSPTQRDYFNETYGVNLMDTSKYFNNDGVSVMGAERGRYWTIKLKFTFPTCDAFGPLGFPICAYGYYFEKLSEPLVLTYHASKDNPPPSTEFKKNNADWDCSPITLDTRLPIEEDFKFCVKWGDNRGTDPDDVWSFDYSFGYPTKPVANPDLPTEVNSGNSYSKTQKYLSWSAMTDQNQTEMLTFNSGGWSNSVLCYFVKEACDGNYSRGMDIQVIAEAFVTPSPIKVPDAERRRQLDNNPDLAAVNAMVHNTFYRVQTGLEASYEFIVAGTQYAPEGQLSYFFKIMKDCLTKQSPTGKTLTWDPLSCLCFPATITAEKCAENIDTPEPLNVVVGSANTRYKDGAIDVPPVSLLPYQELTCPLEVNFADDRTPDMSPKKQRDNVYVESSTLLADIPTAFESIGRGCYMCFANRYNNLTKTLEDETLSWLGQYHPDRCRGKRVIPTVKGTLDDIFEQGGKQQQTDPLSLYLPGRDFRYTMDQPLGVYTLYPYFELEPIPYQFARNINEDPAPASGCTNCGPENENFKIWERNLARQIGYYLDPDWWVTVEVTGVEKAKGGQVLRNFHGRIMEEGLVDFEANEFTYNVFGNVARGANEFGDSIRWENYLNAGKNPFYPNNCIFNTINMDIVKSDMNGQCVDSDGKPEAKTDSSKGSDCVEIACESDIPGDTAYNILKGNLTVNFNIDIGDWYNGYNEILNIADPTWAKSSIYDTDKNPYTVLIASTETAGGFILPKAYDGITNDIVEKAIEAVTTVPLLRRKDGLCIDRPGQVKIEMPFAAQCLFGLDTEKTTRSVTRSACQPDKVVEWYNQGGTPTLSPGAPGPQPTITMEEWLQDMFLEVHPTGVAKDILDVFDSIEFKLALALLAFEDPELADINYADIIWCLSPLGPTSPFQIIEFLLLFCQACTPGSDSSGVRDGLPGECFTYEGGAPCLGYVGPPDPGSSDRNTPGWASVTVSEYPVPCMFEQVSKIIRPAIPLFPVGDKRYADNGELELYNMCDLQFLQYMLESPYKFRRDMFPPRGPFPQQINDESVAGIVLSGFTYLDNVPNIVDEINIMGVTVESALFARTDPTMFPNGLFVTSTHPLIHTKISRDLGSGEVTSRGCNVALIGMPNITFYNVEFDNSACQEQGLNQLTYESANDFRGIEGSPPTFERAFKELKAWNMAPVHITNLMSEYSPTDLNFTSVKLTASTTFRRMFPGRPLVSVDNDGAVAGAFVNVDKMFLSEINDTHKYRDTRDVNSGSKDPVDLMPLHIIFWHTAGEVTLGVFQDEFDIVTFSERNAFKLDYQISSTQETDVACKGDIKSPAALDAQNGNTLLQYKTKCLSLNCEIQVGGKPSTDWDDQKKNVFCRKIVRIPIVNNVVVLDGNDFFDM